MNKSLCSFLSAIITSGMSEESLTLTLTCSRRGPGKSWPGFRDSCTCPSGRSSSASPRRCTLAPCSSTSWQSGSAARVPAQSCSSSADTGSWSGANPRAAGPGRPPAADDRLGKNSSDCLCPGRRKGGGDTHGWAGWHAWRSGVRTEREASLAGDRPAGEQQQWACSPYCVA